MTNQTKNNKLNYLINPTFCKVNRFFVLSLENENDITQNNKLNYLINPTFCKVNRFFVLSLENENDITSFSKYYVPNFRIKDFKVLINGKYFLTHQ